MSSHRIITPEINDAELVKVIAALELTRPVRIRVRNRSTAGREMGRLLTKENLTPGVHQISLECDTRSYRAMKPGQIQRELLVTLLHELRHAHQEEHWDPADIEAEKSVPYRARPSEIDAESWAQTQAERFKDLVRFKSRYTQTPLGRVERAVASARQTV